MEVYIFCITITVLAVFGILCIGICIGRSIEDNERTDSRSLHYDNNSTNVRNLHSNMCISNMGDNDWK